MSRGADHAGLIARRSGECTPTMAEQLTFEEVARNRGAVERDVRFRRAGRHVVQCARDDLLADARLTLDDLGPKISAKLENKTTKEVFMRADQRANYGKVMDAVDGIRSAGVSQLGLLTERVDDTAAATTPAKK